MGAWGFGSFENDDALDWTGEFVDAPSAATVARTLGKVTETAGYVEAPDASMALAAAEVVAATMGRSGGDLPEELASWAIRTPGARELALAASALTALDRIVGDASELHELWAETDDLQSWLDVVDELRKRLQTIPVPTS